MLDHLQSLAFLNKTRAKKIPWFDIPVFLFFHDPRLTKLKIGFRDHVTQFHFCDTHKITTQSKKQLSRVRNEK